MLLDLHLATYAYQKVHNLCVSESAQLELDIKQSLIDTTASNPASNLLKTVTSDKCGAYQTCKMFGVNLAQYAFSAHTAAKRRSKPEGLDSFLCNKEDFDC